jgi:CSLREA domain-containing protein
MLRRFGGYLLISMSGSMRRTAIVILFLSLCCQFKITSALQSDIILVDTRDDVVADDGKCSLREAIAKAARPKSSASQATNDCSGGGGAVDAIPVIKFADSLREKVIVSKPLTISSSVKLQGPGRLILALSGEKTTRIFFIEKSAEVTISDLEIRDAADSAIYNNGGTLSLNNCNLLYNASLVGGAIYNNRGTLLLNHVAFSHNRAGSGGTIFNDGGIVTLNDTIITDSFVSVGGGAIHSQGGELSIRASTFENNKGSLYGGAIFIQTGTATVTASLFANNEARKGGGIYTERADLTVLNSTLIENHARGALLGGGALFIDSGAVSVVFSTLAYNVGPEGNGYGGAIYNRLGTLKLRNSIVALNMTTFGPDIIGQVDSQGYNLISQEIDGKSTTDIVTQNPRLARGLGFRVVPLKMLALIADSPAIDAIPLNQCNASTDGRGIPRPWGFRCDIGAYEHDTRPVGPAGSMRAD